MELGKSRQAVSDTGAWGAPPLPSSAPYLGLKEQTGKRHCAGGHFSCKNSGGGGGGRGFPGLPVGRNSGIPGGGIGRTKCEHVLQARDGVEVLTTKSKKEGKWMENR